ncbi:thioesterase, FlK family [Amycolatopsis magusensis]|uniref:thioesterase, FlK family n=1 Tax=Amycolatopsis magusensis TaxID=882444 RepID=UPI0037B15B55
MRYQTSAKDSVRLLADRTTEVARKPDIVASLRLLELCERLCVAALRESLEPHEHSLGAHHRLDHRAPIPIGAPLAITACCTVAAPPYSEWDVYVHDGHKTVGRATLGFIVVDHDEFERQCRRSTTLQFTVGI